MPPAPPMELALALALALYTCLYGTQASHHLLS